MKCIGTTLIAGLIGFGGCIGSDGPKGNAELGVTEFKITETPNNGLEVTAIDRSANKIAHMTIVTGRIKFRPLNDDDPADNPEYITDEAGRELGLQMDLEVKGASWTYQSPVWSDGGMRQWVLNHNAYLFLHDPQIEPLLKAKYNLEFPPTPAARPKGEQAYNYNQTGWWGWNWDVSNTFLWPCQGSSYAYPGDLMLGTYGGYYDGLHCDNFNGWWADGSPTACGGFEAAAFHGMYNFAADHNYPWDNTTNHYPWSVIVQACPYTTAALPGQSGWPFTFYAKACNNNPTGTGAMSVPCGTTQANPGACKGCNGSNGGIQGDWDYDSNAFADFFTNGGSKEGYIENYNYNQIGTYNSGASFCGDNVCDGGESCNDCPNDCGGCPQCDGYGSPCNPSAPETCCSGACYPDGFCI